jgi:hypothetical protein
MESVTREQLRELFSQAGEVTKVDIPDGGRSMVSGCDYVLADTEVRPLLMHQIHSVTSQRSVHVF